jgi:hypothetical protein
MAAVFGLAGWHFCSYTSIYVPIFLHQLTRPIASNPTSASGGGEKKVPKVPGSEPWITGKDAHYQYYPYGDTSAEKKDAPSALHVSIIPNVNLPKVRYTLLACYGIRLTTY